MTADKRFVSKIERGLLHVEHRDDPAINLCVYDFLCNIGIQYIYGSSKEFLSTFMPKDDNTEVWLFNTSDSENVLDE